MNILSAMDFLYPTTVDKSWGADRYSRRRVPRCAIQARNAFFSRLEQKGALGVYVSCYGPRRGH